MNSVLVALIVTLAVQAFGTMVMFAPAVLAPAAQVDVGMPASSIGGLISIGYLGALAATLVSGQAIARFGPLRWSQINLLISAFGIALIASAKLPLVIAGAAVIGVGYGPYTPASSAILVKRTPEKLRATVLSIKQSGVPGGGVLAGVLIPPLILAFGWQAAALALAAMCALLAMAIQPTREQFDRGEAGSVTTARQAVLEPVRMLWAHARLRELGYIAFMYSGMQMVFVSFFVVYLTQRVGLTLVNAGGALAAGMVSGVLGRVLWGVVADRLVGPRALLGWLGLGSSAATCALALMGAHWPVPAVYAVGIAMGMTSIAWNGVFLAEVARTAPQGNVGTATSAALMFAYGGVVCMPALCWGAISLTGSYEATFAIVAAVNAAVALLPLRRRA